MVTHTEIPVNKTGRKDSILNFVISFKEFWEDESEERRSSELSSLGKAQRGFSSLYRTRS